MQLPVCQLSPLWGGGVGIELACSLTPSWARGMPSGGLHAVSERIRRSEFTLHSHVFTNHDYFFFERKANILFINSDNVLRYMQYFWLLKEPNISS